MAKKNLSALGKQHCPCQNDLPEPEWQADTLVEVKSRHYYERQHDPDEHATMFSSGPDIPTTEDGTEITRENYPDANFVCPACEQEFLAVVDVYPIEEKGERPENTLTDDDWDTIREAVEMHEELADKDLENLIEKLDTDN